MNRLTLIGGAVAIVIAFTGFKMLLDAQYRAGVQDTVTKFTEADAQEAQNVRELAQEALRDLAGVTDPDELLRRTGGLRD